MRKLNSHLIERHIDLQKQRLQGGYRKWWPNFIYHTTSLENAVNILSDGRILSRFNAQDQARLRNDIADSSVISSTDSTWKSFARFYLRPKTPTLYINEGCKPWNEIINQAHCAVPICFLLNAKEVLTRSDCIFSDGNLASSGAKTGNDADFFLKMPFDKIYHEGPHNDRSITFHRNAEAVIPNSLDLSSLEYIACRTEAEKETLLELLEYDLRFKWKDKIGVLTRYPVFNEEWNFIREVKWNRSEIIIKFNEQNRKARGPFSLEIGISQIWNSQVGPYIHLENDYILPNDYKIGLNSFANKSLNVWVKMDSNLMYQNSFHSMADLPF